MKWFDLRGIFRGSGEAIRQKVGTTSVRIATW